VARWIGIAEEQAGQGSPALFAGVPGGKDRLHTVFPSREVHRAAESENHDGFFPSAATSWINYSCPTGISKAAIPALRFLVVEADAKDHDIGLPGDRKGHRIDHGGQRSDADAQAGNASDRLRKLLEHDFM
jgi:hypothetical protein